jgi:transposase InsO family protein
MPIVSSKTGVDYFGPMTVTIGRRHEKRWGVLFTCLTARSVHLELSPSLDTDQMLMALMRFINRRGRPENMHSDNGTNFVGADCELKRSLLDLDKQKLSTYLAIKGIRWHFIPPAAPHMGGSWERLAQSVKKTLARLLKEQSQKEFTLLTLCTEVENLINSRPITWISADSEDSPALTPNDFIRPSTFLGPSLEGLYEDRDLILRKQWRQAQRMADHFWQRWSREYLSNLNKRDKWTQDVRSVQVDDVVVVIDDQQPRVVLELTKWFVW